MGTLPFTGTRLPAAGFRSPLSELDVDGYVHSHPKKTREFYKELVCPCAVPPRGPEYTDRRAPEASASLLAAVTAHRRVV